MWPCALCYSILKILCQLLQTAPDAVTDTAWVYTLRCGDLTHTHTQVIPGIDPLGLLLWQSHHSGIELLPQLLFLQKHLRCLRLQYNDLKYVVFQGNEEAYYLTESVFAFAASAMIPIMAKTQLGYEQSEKNFEIDPADGVTLHYYSRYGDRKSVV